MKKAVILRKELMDTQDEIKACKELIERKAEMAKDETIEVEARELLINEVASEKANLEKLEARAEQLKIDAKEAQEREEREFSMDNRLSSEGIAENVVERKSIYETIEYRDAYFESIKKNDMSIVQRFVSTNDSGTSTGGEVVVPVMIMNEIQDRIMQGGRIASLCKIVSMATLLEIPFVVSTTGASIHIEGSEAPAEEEIELKNIMLNPDFIKKWIGVTDKMEAMSISDFGTWLMKEMVDKILAKLDEQILLGAQTDAVKGITTNTDVLRVNDLTAHVLNFNTPNSAVALLDDGTENNAVIVMNRKTFLNNVMALVDTTGQPIYRIMNDNMGKPSFMFGGYRVVFSNLLPAYDTATTGQVYAVVGDFSGYLLNTPKGYAVNLERNPYSKMKENIIEYVAKLLVAGDVASPLSFVNVKKA